MSIMIKCKIRYTSGQCIAVIRDKKHVLKVIRKRHKINHTLNITEQQTQELKNLFDQKLEQVRTFIKIKKETSSADKWQNVDLISGKIQYINGDCFFIPSPRSRARLE